MAADQDRVGLGLRHTRRNRADAGARHEFYADRRLRIDLLEVVDQLRQVFDRIDVVVRRRTDERHTRRRMPQLGDQGRHLEARQLSALAGFSTLGHLDFDLTARVQVLGRHAKPAAADLLDRAACVVAIGAGDGARRVLAALAAVGPCADAVHGDAERLMRFRAQRAERDAWRHQALADFGDAFNLIDRYGDDPVRAEVQQVPQRYGLLPAHAFHVAAVGLEAVVGHRRLQRVDQPAIERVHLALAAQLVHAAHRQRVALPIPSRLVQRQDLARNAGQADAADTGLHTGEELGHECPRQADRLEIVAAAVRADDGNAHLGHHLQQALVDRFLVALHGLLGREGGEQPAPVPVGDAFLRQIGVDRGGADANQHGEIMRVQALAAADVERRERAQRLTNEMRVHGGGGEDHGYGCPARVLGGVGQYDVGAAGPHALFRLGPDALDRGAQAGLAVRGFECTINVAGGGPHHGDHRLELGVGQHGAFQLQQVALAAVFVQHVAEVAEPRAQGHDPRFAQAVDRRVGDLREALAEIMVQAAIVLAQHCHGRVITHAADGLRTILHHRVQDHLQVFHRGPNRKLAAAQFCRIIACRLGAIGLDHLVDPGDALGPVAERLAGGERVLQLLIEVQPRFVQIDPDCLAGADAAFLDDLAFVELHHASFAADHQQLAVGYGKTQRAQAITVQPGNHPTAIRRGDGGRAVPRLHDCVAIQEHVAVRGRHRAVLPGAGRDHQRLGHRRIPPGTAQQLKHVIQGRGVGPARLNDWLHVVYQRPQFPGCQAGFVRLHPVAIASDGVDLAVMRQHPERLRQLPGREGVGAVALVVNGEPADEARVQQVRIELGQRRGQEHALVDDAAARQRADVELRHLRGDDGFFDPAADDVQITLELVGVGAGAADHDLLDLGPGSVGLFADAGDVDRHLTPAIDAVAKLQDLGFHDLPATLLCAKVGLGQEHHAHRDTARRWFVAGAANGFGKEILRDFDVDAGAVAGLAIGVDCAPVPNGLQRIDTGLHHVAPGDAIEGCDHADAACVMFLRRVVRVFQRGGIGGPGGEEGGSGLGHRRAPSAPSPACGERVGVRVLPGRLARVPAGYSAATARACCCMYSCILAAASRPSRMAHTTRLAPRTMSPAANTPGAAVICVR